MPAASTSEPKDALREDVRAVETTGKAPNVTDDHRPAVQRVPSRAADVFGDVRGRVVYHEDILAPSTNEWGEP